MDSSNIIVSVIIPIINRLEALENICLPSLAMQSFLNFEVIIWNTSDNNKSQIVVNEFLEKYPDLCIKIFPCTKERIGISKE
jgi:glycosyltransferase involved in cell wall biosynthesis